MRNSLVLSLFVFVLFAPRVYAAPDFTWLEEVRKNCRQTIMGLPPVQGVPVHYPKFSPIFDDDRAENLVEDPSHLIRNIQAMDQGHLQMKAVSVAPWSDTYWPLYLGALGQRYDDPSYVTSSWKDANAYVTKNPARKLIEKREFDLLSPSEKYDFVMGITQNTLTSANWAEGAQYQRAYGSVETWMGLCHGWSAAAIMMPNPAKKVTVPTDAGEVNFYPSDIKALGTLLWAKGNAKSRFIGGRCNAQNPVLDSMGRPREQACLDTNPGTWHLAIVNEIGQFNHSFVMDANYDYQVWNQPVFGYQYTYYNPKTGKDVPSLKDAIVSRSEWSADPRKSVRAPESQSIVGVKMVVTYVVETSPDKTENQEPRFGTAEYDYDLELDRKLDIVGGEWYSDNHPDFLWVPEQTSFPKTAGDSNRMKVNLDLVSDEVKKAAALNSPQGLPFGAVVREFFRRSSI